MARHFIEDEGVWLDLPDGISPEEMEQVVNASFPSKAKGPTGLGGLTAEEANNVPSFFGGKIKGMGHPGQLTTPPPEWKQNVMKGVNMAPDLGQAAGEAIGLANVLKTGPTPATAMMAPKNIAMIPAIAGAGRAVGESVVDPLARMLGFTPEGRSTPGMTTRQGLQGATNAAANSVLNLRAAPAAGRILVKNMRDKIGPSQNLEGLLNAGQEMDQAAYNSIKEAGKGIVAEPTPVKFTQPGWWASHLTRRNLRPDISTMSPAKARNLVDITKNYGIKLADATGEKGMGKIAHNLKQAGNAADEILEKAANSTGAESLIRTKDILDPINELISTFSRGDTPAYITQIKQYVDDFAKMHPEDLVSAAEAQKIKRAIYSSIPDTAWTKQTFNPRMEAKKAVSAHIPKLQEKAVGEATSRGKTLKEANKTMSDMLSLRPTASQAVNRIQNAPWRQRVNALNNQGNAAWLNKLDKWARRVPMEETRIDTIGSPIKVLEDLLGTSKFKGDHGWEPAESDLVSSDPLKKKYGIKTHPDWFEGLEPSKTARTYSNITETVGNLSKENIEALRKFIKSQE